MLVGMFTFAHRLARTLDCVSQEVAKAIKVRIPCHLGGMRAAFILTIVFWAAVAAQWPLHDLVVPWDSKNQFYAFFRFLASALHEGATPFWNPYHYAGHPSIADPQSLIFSPVFVLWALFDPAPSLFAFDLMVSAHLLVGALGIVRYGKRHHWTPAGAVLAAMIFMIGGSVSSRLSHVGIITAYSLFPLALLWMETALSKRSLLAALAFGAAAAFIVLGRSQVPLLLCFTLAAFTLHTILVQRRPLQFAYSRIGILCLSGGTMLAIIIVPMLLTIQFAEFSNRPEIDVELALRSSLYPANIANFFVPDIFGSLRPISQLWGPGYFTRPDVDSTDRAFNYLFSGSLTALLFVWHGLMCGRAFKGGARIFTILAIVSAAYALGRYTPIFPFLFNHAPGIDLFRRPVDGTFLFILGLAYLSGILATNYVHEGISSRRLSCLGLGCAATVAVLVWAVIFSSKSGKAWVAAAEIAKVTPVYLGLLALLILPKSQKMRAMALSLAVFFTSGELVWRNTATVMNSEPRSVYAMLESPTTEAARILDSIKRDMQTRTEGIDRPRVEVVGMGGPWQNAAMVYGIESTNGYNPLRIGSYDRLVAPGEATYTTLHRFFPASFPSYDCRLGKLLGLEYIVLDRPIEQMPNLARRTVAEAILSGPKIWIYRLGNVTSRVSIVNRVQVASAEDYVKAGEFPASTATADVMLDSEERLMQIYGSKLASEDAKAKITHWAIDRIEIEVATKTPAILTLRDPWYPGWQVEVDGLRKPMLRADILFRGVELPIGARKVVFSYHPLSFENLSSIVLNALADWLPTSGTYTNGSSS